MCTINELDDSSVSDILSAAISVSRGFEMWRLFGGGLTWPAQWCNRRECKWRILHCDTTHDVYDLASLASFSKASQQQTGLLHLSLPRRLIHQLQVEYRQDVHRFRFACLDWPFLMRRSSSSNVLTIIFYHRFTCWLGDVTMCLVHCSLEGLFVLRPALQLLGFQ